MKRILLALGVLAALAFLVAPASAQWNGCKPGFCINAASSFGTTWNPLDKGADMALSNNNLTAANTSASSPYELVRGTTSKTSAAGKIYFEYNTGSTYTNAFTQPGFGIGTSTVVAGNGSNAVLVFYTGGTIYVNNVSTGSTIGTPSTNQNFGVAIDFGAQLIWFRMGTGNWNGSGTANPATGVGGISISSVFASTPAFPLYMTSGSGVSGNILTINTAGPFTNGPPSGFSAWN